jgi:amino acid transporter
MLGLVALLARFWGFQAAWLALANSVVDMALYPTLFVLYLSRLWPGVASGNNAWRIGLGIIVACAAVNILGIRVVGHVSVALTTALLAAHSLSFRQWLWSLPRGRPLRRHIPGHADILGGILIAMWCYSGWDDASTIAGEVDQPQRNYPLVLVGVLVLALLIYTLPVLSRWRTAGSIPRPGPTVRGWT